MDQKSKTKKENKVETTTQTPKKKTENSPSAMDKEIKRDALAVKNQIDKLQEALEIANENGLLKNDSAKYEEIIRIIAKALRNLSSTEDNVIQARENFSLAYFKFNEAVNSEKGWWRFKYSHGGPIIIYLLAVFAALLASWLLFWPSLWDYKILWIPSWAFIWGSLGGALQGLWWLWQHVSGRRLRRQWFMWYLVLPLMGAVFGALIYLVYVSGLIVATGDSKVSSEFFIILLCAIAGFSSKWMVQVLDKVTQIIQIGK